MLDERKLKVLRAVVTAYVSSQEPVGSKSLVEQYDLGVSPATVRNDMATLEDEGYITQPHTSAGRIPTDKGYRLFVDRLCAVQALTQAQRRAIQTFMGGAADIDDVVSRTVRLLAQVTQQVAIVQYPILGSATIRHFELVSISADRVLLVLVDSSGQVKQSLLELPGHDREYLSTLRNEISARLLALTVADAASRIPQLLATEVEPSNGTRNALSAALLELLSPARESRVVVAGVPNLTRQAGDFASVVRPVLEALEEQVVLLRLLSEVSRAGEIAVTIGQENPYRQLQSTSMIAATYGPPHGAAASLGIVGPTRMDYPATIASVRAVAQYLSRLLDDRET